MCDVEDFACSYHMRYTRGYEKSGGDWAPLSALYVGKVAIQKDILEKQPEGKDLSEGEREEIQIELEIINKRLCVVGGGR